jgi:hypothetical protein
MSAAEFRASPSPYPEVKSKRTPLFLTKPSLSYLSISIRQERSEHSDTKSDRSRAKVNIPVKVMAAFSAAGHDERTRNCIWLSRCTDVRKTENQ